MIKVSLQNIGLVCVALSLLTFSVVESSSFAIATAEQALVYESYSLEAAGKIPAAIEKMRMVLKKNARDYGVHYRLGWLSYLNKKYKHAESHYKKAALVSPGSIEPWLAITLMYVNAAEYIRVLPAALEVIKRDPKNYYANQRLILAYLRTKQYSRVRERVENMIRLYPSDPVFLEQQAFMLKETGDLAQARTVASQLLLLSPKNPYAHSLMQASEKQ